MPHKVCLATCMLCVLGSMNGMHAYEHTKAATWVCMPIGKLVIAVCLCAAVVHAALSLCPRIHFNTTRPMLCLLHGQEESIQ